MLSQTLAARLTTYATQIKAQTQQAPSGDDDRPAALFDPEVAEQILMEALQPELDRLVQVPFGVPLLHEIG